MSNYPDNVTTRVGLGFHFFPRLLRSPALCAVRSLLSMQTNLLSHLLTTTLRGLSRRVQRSYRQYHLLEQFYTLYQSARPVFCCSLRRIIRYPEYLVLARQQYTDGRGSYIGYQEIRVSVVSPSMSPTSVSRRVS